MTRINVVPPAELSRAHLIAEYRELPRVFTLARKRAGSEDGVPADYVLGKGHVLFFTRRLGFLADRYRSLIAEMLRRGYAPNPVPIGALRRGIPKAAFGAYAPTPAALAANRARIAERGGFTFPRPPG